MHPVPGVRYGSYTCRVREVRVWSCRIHDYDVSPDPYDDYYGEEYAFDFPEYGCTCGTSARWAGTGVWKYVMEGVISSILRDFYLPPIIEMLNNEILLGEIWKRTP